MLFKKNYSLAKKVFLFILNCNLRFKSKTKIYWKNKIGIFLQQSILV